MDIIYLILLGIAVGSIALSRNKKFIDGLAETIEQMHQVYKAWQLEKQEKWEHENPAKLFLVEHTFHGQTLSGFNILYWMNLHCERLDVPLTVKEQLHSPIMQEILAREFHDGVFEPHFKNRSCFWHLDYRMVSALGKLYQVFPTIIGEVAEEDGNKVVREVLRQRMKAEVMMLPPFHTRGCEIRLMDFSTPELSDEDIERNYTVLSDEEKDAIMATPQFGIAAEMLAVTLLKYRLDFLRGGSKKYKADDFTIETEQAGRSLKIKWKFKPNVEGYYLWGFRDTGGFSNDQFNENANGKRVIDSFKDEETTEVLDEGVAYFYTFFLKPFQETDRWTKKSPLRFQVTIETKAETEAIEQAMRRFEERKQPEPEKENLSKALKEIGSYVEMDRAFESMEKSFIGDIAKSDYSEEEKRRKIERLQDVIVQIRSKYEPV